MKEKMDKVDYTAYDGFRQDAVDTNLDKDIEKKTLMKIDSRILPLVCVAYLFTYLDRTNIGKVLLL